MRVNGISPPPQRPLLGRSTDRSGSTADIDVSISRLKVSVGSELVELSQAQ
jgi:hypothetical protein